jgi:hypothetical protein
MFASLTTQESPLLAVLVSLAVGIGAVLAARVLAPSVGVGEVPGAPSPRRVGR